MPLDMLTSPSDGTAFPTVHRTAVLRLEQGRAEACDDHVIEEVPVALVYNRISHAVMLASPENLEDLGLGFSLSEGILAGPGELFDIAVREGCDGLEVHMDIPLERFMALKDRRRSMTARTGCGMCGVEKLEAVARVKGTVTRGAPVPAAAVSRALADFAEHQRLHQLTGAVHGVAWVDRMGTIQAIREDVGRHNALDKLVGWLARTGTDATNGFVLTSSRASFEMVQKAAAVGIGCLVAISAPTALAVRLAEGCGLTLAGFARGQRLVVYSHPGHLVA
ncbi:formate dehydrogenase accessory sulfurtransferase FdhD [Azospirillum soli]|uniref:formate dehydrogenase accessory sulfurtransferase FdhD n=1 Tax=Azospirillum soli TaxID=1304799 RepID=UPI001FEAD90A|nr:formate dehydrogenase accessory sulfurtransferase FdhD [Azospirillum soli]MBP2314577.1 FdhD protein [Azospirillum soli]